MEIKPKPLAPYKVYQYEEGMQLPEKGKYYVITKDGIFFRKETKVASAFVKIDGGIPWLGSLDTDATLNLPKIPGRIIGQALMFFRTVFKKLGSESYVTLLYSETKGFQLWCPKQEVSRGSVSYDRTDQPDFSDRKSEGWQMIGTIHSHCDFSAFHSGTDTGDEETFDGIHITLGHVNRDDFSMVSSIALNASRFTLDPEGCCDGIKRVTANDKSSKYMTWSKSEHFELDLSDEEMDLLEQDVEIIKQAWMPKVTKETSRFSGSYFPKSKGFGFRSFDSEY